MVVEETADRQWSAVQPLTLVADQVARETRGVKCGRRGAVRAATANHRLRFLGFARNDRAGSLWWNDREVATDGGMTLGTLRLEGLRSGVGT